MGREESGRAGIQGGDSKSLEKELILHCEVISNPRLHPNEVGEGVATSLHRKSPFFLSIFFNGALAAHGVLAPLLISKVSLYVPQVIGVPQPTLKWFKDGEELKPGDIHRIISGEGGTCCLGRYTCEAHNCMGSASSSASLLGFEDTGSKFILETFSSL